MGVLGGVPDAIAQDWDIGPRAPDVRTACQITESQNDHMLEPAGGRLRGTPPSSQQPDVLARTERTGSPVVRYSWVTYQNFGWALSSCSRRMPLRLTRKPSRIQS